MSSQPSTFQTEPFTLITTPRFQTGATDQYTHTATEMACVHNCVIRAFNSIYHHAPLVAPSEYRSFLSYSHSLYVGLQAHHGGEESFIFPTIEAATGEKGIMDANVAQHHAFHSGLDAFSSYLEDLLATDVSKFDPHKLCTIIESFAPALNEHLHDEIPTLLALSRYGDSLDLKGIVEKEAQLVMGSLSKTGVMPVFLLNHDVGFEGGIHADFPPIPTPVKWVFMNVLTLWQFSWWKYATCNFSGKLKAMPRDRKA